MSQSIPSCRFPLPIKVNKKICEKCDRFYRPKGAWRFKCMLPFMYWSLRKLKHDDMIIKMDEFYSYDENLRDGELKSVPEGCPYTLEHAVSQDAQIQP